MDNSENQEDDSKTTTPRGKNFRNISSGSPCGGIDVVSRLSPTQKCLTSKKVVFSTVEAAAAGFDSAAAARFPALVDRIITLVEHDTMGIDETDRVVNSDIDSMDLAVAMRASRAEVVKLVNSLAGITDLTLYGIDDPDLPTEVLMRFINTLDVLVERTEHQMEFSMSSLCVAADAAVVALLVMTCDGMPKQVFVEESIQHIIVFVKRCLEMIVFPVFDPSFRLPRDSNSSTTSKPEVELLLLHFSDIFLRFAELVNKRTLTDSLILQCSTIALSPFFVENVNSLQLSALPLARAIFSKYKIYRSLMFDDILNSMAKLPTNKKLLRNYRVGNESIQMITALILTLIQSCCSVALPRTDEVVNSSDRDYVRHRTPMIHDDTIVHIMKSFDDARTVENDFLVMLMNKASSSGKRDDVNYRVIFSNFLHDLLGLLYMPEWPAAELMLLTLSNHIMVTVVSHASSSDARLFALENLGLITAKLKEYDGDAIEKVFSFLDLELKEPSSGEKLVVSSIADVCNDVTSKVLPYATEEQRAQWTADLRILTDLVVSAEISIADRCELERIDCTALETPNSKSSDVKTHLTKELLDFRRVFALQQALFQQLFIDNTDACYFYISQWLNAANIDPSQCSKKPWLLELSQVRYTTYMDLWTSVKLNTTPVKVLERVSAQRLARLLGLRGALRSNIVNMLYCMMQQLNDSTPSLRTKALRCLACVIRKCPSVLGDKKIVVSVRKRCVDMKPTVREAAVNLVGQFVLEHTEFISQYYPMIAERARDTSIAVRKRVIRILRDLIVKQAVTGTTLGVGPARMCFEMAKRIHDHDVKDFVVKMFEEIFFSPPPSFTATDVLEEDPKVVYAISANVSIISDVVSLFRSCNDISSLQWLGVIIDQLLEKELERKSSPLVMTICRIMVDALVESSLRAMSINTSALLPIVTTLYLFAKIRQVLLIPHLETLLPYLSVTIHTREDAYVPYFVTLIFEKCFPLTVRPDPTITNKLEMSLSRHVLSYEQVIVGASIAALAASVRTVSHNVDLMCDLIATFYSFLHAQRYANEQCDTRSADAHFLLRSLFAIGHLCQHFDFDVIDNVQCVKDVSQLFSGPATVFDKVFDMLMYFATTISTRIDTRIRNQAIVGLEALYIGYPRLLIRTESQQLLSNALVRSRISSNSDVADGSVSISADTDSSLTLRILKLIEKFLIAEEKSMLAEDAQRNIATADFIDSRSGNADSGVSCALAQIFCDPILELTGDAQLSVRYVALSVSSLMLQQGLFHPAKSIPYLVCRQIDDDACTRDKAYSSLVLLEKNHPSLLVPGVLQGLERAHLIFQQDGAMGVSPDDYKVPPTALRGERFGGIYVLIRDGSRQRRKSFLDALMKLFRRKSRDVAYMMFLADLLATLPYVLAEEALFLILHLSHLIRICGSDVIANLDNTLQPIIGDFDIDVTSISEDSIQGLAALLNGIESRENNVVWLRLCDLRSTCWCVLLMIALRHHLQTRFGFSESKCNSFVPTDTSNVTLRSTTTGVIFDGANLLASVVGTDSVSLARLILTLKVQVTAYTDGDGDDDMNIIDVSSTEMVCDIPKPPMKKRRVSS